MEAVVDSQQNTEAETITFMKSVLERQQKAFLNEGFVTAETRIDRIDRAISLLVDHQGELTEAMSADFGHRSCHQSRMADFYGSLEPLKHSKKSLRKWMRHDRRKAPFPMGLFGAKAHVEYVPKGVVGNIATWNFPTHVPISPLSGIFAAGNRAMIKLSEVTPETSALLQHLISQYYDETECVGITGGPKVGAAFAGLPLDHILFTGATGVGRHILRAAADNLTPVTLELGGKSPVVVSRSAPLDKTAMKIVVGKILNVGQVCLSPDYMYVPKENLNDMIAEMERAFGGMFSHLLNNPDYGSIVNDRHHQRLQSYIQDCLDKGGEVRQLNPAKEDFSQQTGTNKMPLTLVIDPTDDMLVMQEELFGPVICIRTYGQVDEAIQFINSRPRPLALYYFGEDKDEQRHVLDRTISGAVSVNDVMAHVGCEELPFGGVGASGMGYYHGYDGFKTFSHARSVFKQTKPNMMVLAGMVPPYGEKMEAQLKRMIKK